jgi:hypothetical protein
MPLKKSARSKTSTSSRKSVRSKASTGFTRRIGTGAIVMVAVCGIAAAMLMAARESPELAGDVQSQSVGPQAMSPVRARTLAADVTPAHNPPAAPMTPSVTNAAPVTLAGCLERANETFRLKDTEGVDAPKSRSWKSGFLKRSSASIELVDPANGLRLTSRVGQRVSVTGILADGQMRVRSLRRVAGSCK